MKNGPLLPSHETSVADCRLRFSIKKKLVDLVHSTEALENMRIYLSKDGQKEMRKRENDMQKM